MTDRPSENVVVTWLDHTVNACLAGVLLVAPLFMGGRGPVGQLVFVLLSSLAAITWFARQTLAGGTRWRRSGAEWLLAFGALLIVFQLAPLPQSLLLKLSPAITDLLPLWIGQGISELSLGQWSTLTLTPESTRGGLTIYLSYVLFFLVLLQRLDTTRDVELLLKVVALAAVVMAVVGLAQFFMGSTRFLWVYEHTSRSACQVVRGTFQNENHFAHFLSLGLAPLLWWLRSSVTSVAASKRIEAKRNVSPQAFASDAFAKPLILLSVMLVALAVLLTFSRGGVLTMGMVLVACVAILQWKKLLDRRTTWILSAAVVVNLVALMLFGLDSLSFHLGTVFQASSLGELFATRVDLWNSMCDAISNFYVTGTGVGSHGEVYPTYMEEKYNFKFTHGESGYLPLLLETGCVGLVLMLVGIGISLFWCLATLTAPRRTQSSNSKVDSGLLVNYASAVAPSLIASIIHSVADFVWYIPACMILTVAQLACACRVYQLASKSANANSSASSCKASDAPYIWLPKAVCAGVLGLLLITGWSMVSNRLGPALGALEWDGYLRNSMALQVPDPPPSEQQERLTAMERHLKKILHHNPRDAEAQVRIAAVYLKEFELVQLAAENSMDLSQIRDAALASNFPSKAAQDAWLNVAIGEHRSLLDLAHAHSRVAVTLSPLQGLAYVQLANLSFLEGSRETMKLAYIDQAAQVRPHDGQVLFVRGKEALLARNETAAFEFWKKAFRQDPEIRQIIITSLTDQLPADFFISTFEPETHALGQLFDRYSATGRIDEAKRVALQYIAGLQKDAAAKSHVEAAKCWQQAQSAYSWTGDLEKALQCQQRALELSPLDFDCRRTLAQLLTKQQRFDEAISQYEWCLRRQPDRDDLRNEMADARLQGLRGQSPAPIAARPGTRRS